MTNLTLVIGNKTYSSWSLRPWLAMKQFGLDFEEVYISLYQQDSSAKIKQYSAAGKVPILIHKDFTIWDSLAICEYLAAEFNWWNQDKKTIALVRSVCAEMHSGFLNLRQQMPMNCRKNNLSVPIAPPLEKDIFRITEIWREFRQQFASEGKMLFGDFTIADAFYAPVVLRFVTYGVQLDDISQEYMENILALPALQQWIKEAQSETEIISNFEVKH